MKRDFPAFKFKAMNIEETVNKLHDHVEIALKDCDKMREALFSAIREYLSFKHENQISFLPDDEEIMNLLGEQGFHPCVVTMFEDNDHATVRIVDTIRLDENGIISVIVENGSILTNFCIENQIKICNAIDEYEKALERGIMNEVQQVQWKAQAVKTLLDKTGESLEEALDFVEFYWKSETPEEYNIELFKSVINH